MRQEQPSPPDSPQRLNREQGRAPPRSNPCEFIREGNKSNNEYSGDMHEQKQVGSPAASRAFDFDLGRPVKPRWPNAELEPWVTRQDAGLAALGQGWPFAPRFKVCVRVCRA